MSTGVCVVAAPGCGMGGGGVQSRASWILEICELRRDRREGGVNTADRNFVGGNEVAVGFPAASCDVTDSTAAAMHASSTSHSRGFPVVQNKQPLSPQSGTGLVVLPAVNPREAAVCP